MTPSVEDIATKKDTAQHVGPSGKYNEQDTEKDARKETEGTEKEHQQGGQDPPNDVELEDSPFIIKKRVPAVTTMSPRKKQKVDRSKGAIPLVLTDGDVDEIGEKVKQVTTDKWS